MASSRCYYGCVLLLVCVAITASGPANGVKRKRGVQKDLSDQEHFKEGDVHNVEYDHEAFLGKEEAKTFSELPPVEAKRRLEVIIDRIDSNKDGELTEEELTAWIRSVSRRYAYDDRDRHWDYHVKDGRKHLSWDDYVEQAYGMIEDHSKIYDVNRNLTYGEVINRYQRRFHLADKDKNKQLDRDEFVDFLHPHDVPEMRTIVIDETFEDMDKNRDGEVTLEEYIDDIGQSYNPNDKSWREREIDQFKTKRDKNGDDKLDKKELELWFFPPNSDPSVNEARHLIYHADTNEDKTLSKEEILSQQDLFVGSQATEHGRIFVRHDEF